MASVQHMGFLDWFRPEWRHSDWRRRLEAVEKIENQVTLARVAKHDEQAVVRSTAVKRITSVATLDEIIEMNKQSIVYSDVRRSAESRRSELLLARIANEKLDAMPPRDLLRRLQRERPNHAWETIKRLNNQQSLAVLARSSLDSTSRRFAVERLDDQAILTEIAFGDDDEWVRAGAAKRLQSEETVAKLVMDESDEVAVAALGITNDTSLVANVALTHPGPRQRAAAVKRLDDPELLREVLQNDGSVDVREAAVERISERELLEKIAFDDPERKVRDAAAKRIGLHGTLCKRCGCYVSVAHETERVETFHEHYGAGTEEKVTEVCASCAAGLPSSDYYSSNSGWNMAARRAPPTQNVISISRKKPDATD